ncbi:uncharacterized protein LOC126749340 [Anthonomus grandis grandis]|uniref:uncharacterized protein LOC126749340 n=1 Tax=Anthonomus grandis grandis TaxID=2921223 RepID=UPI002165F6F9|nr:uncharacterized protein LOC126749340 [Anthonomus grandis grandis]
MSLHPGQMITRTKYKYPLSKNTLKIKKLIDGNVTLEDGQFEWLDTVCKAQSIRDLQMAKKLCERGTYTSNFEITDPECSSEVKRKRKKVKRLFNNITDSSSDENVLLARGQNLIRKVFSSHKALNSQTSNIQDLLHKNKTHFSEPLLENVCEAQFTSSAKPVRAFTNATSAQQTPETSSTPVSMHRNLSTKFSSDLTPLLEEITEIKFYMRETRTILSRIEHFMNNNCKSSNSGDDLYTIGDSRNNFLEKFPCQTKQQLEEVESIITEPKFMKELITFLYLAGGNNPHKSVYMAMQKVFGKELALLYSGQGKKKKIPFCSMKTYQAVFAAIRKRYPDVSDDSIKKSVSLFLATAKSRLISKCNATTPSAEGEVDSVDADEA